MARPLKVGLQCWSPAWDVQLLHMPAAAVGWKKSMGPWLQWAGEDVLSNQQDEVLMPCAGDLHTGGRRKFSLVVKPGASVLTKY